MEVPALPLPIVKKPKAVRKPKAKVVPVFKIVHQPTVVVFK
jgi:hypothetical protein